jgi:hypothetical protein
MNTARKFEFRILIHTNHKQRICYQELKDFISRYATDCLNHFYVYEADAYGGVRHAYCLVISYTGYEKDLCYAQSLAAEFKFSTKGIVRITKTPIEEYFI